MEANGDRILKVITHFCESNADFADKVGVSRQVVGNWINRDNGKKVLDKILTTFPSVNPGWLFTGYKRDKRKVKIQEWTIVLAPDVV